MEYKEVIADILKRRDAEEAHAETVRCPRCAALPSHPCSTSGGYPHQARIVRSSKPPPQLERVCAREGCDNQFTLTGIGRGSTARRYCDEPDCKRQRQQDRDRKKYASGANRMPCALCGGPTGWWKRQQQAQDPVCQPCRRKRAMRTCKYCGNDFHIRYSGDPTIFCSASHFRAWQVEHRQSGPEKYQRQRLRTDRLAATWDGVTNQQIYERDEWICQIPNCTQLTRIINRDAQRPAPDSPSIDHIIPVSRGGGDQSFNRRASHLLCNNVKHNYLDDEIELKPQLEPAPPKQRTKQLPWPRRLYHRPCRWCDRIVSTPRSSTREYTVCNDCFNGKCSNCGGWMPIVVDSRPPETRQCRFCYTGGRPKQTGQPGKHPDLWWTTVKPL